MRRGKFGNVRVTFDGLKFDSKGECARYKVLKAREVAGVISNLTNQVSYRLTVNGVKVCDYRADFRYDRSGVEVVEDYKSKATITPVYRLKKKLMKAVHGIDIHEVFKADDE